MKQQSKKGKAPAQILRVKRRAERLIEAERLLAVGELGAAERLIGSPALGMGKAKVPKKKVAMKRAATKRRPARPAK